MFLKAHTVAFGVPAMTQSSYAFPYLILRLARSCIGLLCGGWKVGRYYQTLYHKANSIKKLSQFGRARSSGQLTTVFRFMCSRVCSDPSAARDQELPILAG